MTQGSLERVKMWTSGATDAGSSSVPPRTNRTRGLVYWLKTATWQVVQRQIFCLIMAARYGDRLRVAGE